MKFNVTKKVYATGVETRLATNATRQECEKVLMKHKMSQLRSKSGGRRGNESAWMTVVK